MKEKHFDLILALLFGFLLGAMFGMSHSYQWGVQKGYADGADKCMQIFAPKLWDKRPKP